MQNFDVAATEATAKEFMNIGLGFDETQYGELAKVIVLSGGSVENMD